MATPRPNGHLATDSEIRADVLRCLAKIPKTMRAANPDDDFRSFFASHAEFRECVREARYPALSLADAIVAGKKDALAEAIRTRRDTIERLQAELVDLERYAAEGNVS